MLDHPIPAAAAWEPPAERTKRRRGSPIARMKPRTSIEVLLRRLPILELAVAVEELRRAEELAVGGLRELPVRW